MHIQAYRLRSLRWWAKVIGNGIMPFIPIVGILIPDALKVGPTEKIGWIVAVLVAYGIGFLLAAWGDREVQTGEGSVLAEEKLLKQYATLLSESVRILPLVGSRPPEALKQAIVEQLRNVCVIAEGFKNDDRNHSHSLNACAYMAIEDGKATEALKVTARPFMDEGRHTYRTFLVLKFWAYQGDMGGGVGRMDAHEASENRVEPCQAIDFALPVDEDENYTLFGSPYTFRTGKRYIVTDVKHEKSLRRERGMHHPRIQTEVINYFKARSSFRSFVTFPIDHADKRCGTLALQSLHAKTWVQRNQRDAAMFKAIEPFLAVLAILMLEYERQGSP